MTTYNTGNQIGSTDARDRLDNSENLDLAVNSLSPTFVDRLGRTRDTLEGVYQKSAYYRAGTFDAGYTLTNNRQTLAYGNVEYSWAGAFPKVVSAGSTPETTGGISSGAWVDRTDLILRTELVDGTVTIISYIHPEKYGAVANSTGVAGVGTDSTQAFIYAADECLLTGKTLKATGKYRITGDIDLRYISVDMTNASIFIDSSTAKVKLGGNSSNANNPEQRFGSCSRIGGATSVPDIRLSGVKGQNIYIESSEYTLVWASTTSGVRDQEYSCAYSNIHIKYCPKLELNTDPLNTLGPANSDVGGSVQWINECNFYLNRTINLLVDGSYNHNHNRFYWGTFEGLSTINFAKGRDNRLYGARFEGSVASVSFGTSTERNIIVNTYDDSEFSGGPETTTATITDLGSQNAVIDDFRLYYKTETVAYADISDVVLSNEVGDLSARLPYLQCIQGSSAFPLMMSDYLPCRDGDYFFWNQSDSDVGDSPVYRPFVRFYDKNLNLITPLTTWVYSPTMNSINGNDLQTSVGVTSAVCHITSVSGAMFVKVGWKASNAQLAQGLSRRLSVLMSSIKPHTTTVLSTNRNTNIKAVSAVPTKGFAPLGFSALKSDMTARYTNKFSFTSTLVSSSVSNILTLTSVAGVLVGDIVGVNLLDRTTHWTTVNSISGNDITLSTGTPSASYVGARVVFNRWVTETI